MDKRIVKTRQALQEALLDLLREKPMEDIEIQAITDKANTARVTFYRHYGTKDELLIDAIEQIYQDIQQDLPFPDVDKLMDFNETPPVYVLFAFLESDRELHKKLLLGTRSALIQQRVRHYIVQEVIRTFSTSPQVADMPIVLIANNLASVTIGNIMWWLGDDLHYTADYMARLTHWMSFTGAFTLFGRGDKIELPSPEVWRITEQ